MDSEMLLCKSADDRIAVLNKQLLRTEKLEKFVMDGCKKGVCTTAEVMEAKYGRLEIQFKLAEEKARKTLGVK